MLNDLFNTFDLLNIKVKRAAFKRELISHPEYPTLLSYADTLNKFAINHTIRQYGDNTLEDGYYLINGLDDGDYVFNLYKIKSANFLKYKRFLFHKLPSYNFKQSEPKVILQITSKESITILSILLKNFLSNLISIDNLSIVNIIRWLPSAGFLLIKLYRFLSEHCGDNSAILNI